MAKFVPQNLQALSNYIRWSHSRVRPAGIVRPSAYVLLPALQPFDDVVASKPRYLKKSHGVKEIGFVA